MMVSGGGGDGGDGGGDGGMMGWWWLRDMMCVLVHAGAPWRDASVACIALAE